MIATSDSSEPLRDEEADSLLSFVNLLRHIAQQVELGDAGEVLVEGVRELVLCDSAELHLGERTWTSPGFEEGERCGSDQRLEIPLSVAHPELGRLTLVRATSAPVFEPSDEEAVRRLATQAAPFLESLRIQAEEWRHEAAATSDPLFRAEAYEARNRSSSRESDPLQVFPRWLGRTYLVLLSCLCLAVAAALIISVEETARGPAMVLADGGTTVAAAENATVIAVEVAPGESVVAGQVLVRLEDDREAGEVERLEEEFARLLERRLRTPEDATVELAMSTLRSRLEQARAHLEDRSIRSPVAGRVTDVRVRPGQFVTPGQFLAAVGEEKKPSKVVALLPGSYRPRLQAGMPLDFELAGFPDVRHALQVTTIGDQVIAGADAQSFVALDAGDPQAVGAVIVVEARLPTETFVSNGVVYQFHEGMRGTVEVPVRRERLVDVLLPQVRDALK